MKKSTAIILVWCIGTFGLLSVMPPFAIPLGLVFTLFEFYLLKKALKEEQK